MPSQSVPERTERLEARITRDQKALFKRAAEMQGRSLSDFVIQVVSDAATQVVREQHIITLTAEEQKTVVKALQSPPKPGPRLREAMRHYRKVMES